MSIVAISCDKLHNVESNIAFISRVNAASLLKVSRSWLCKLEKQSPAMELGYCKFFPELGYKMKILKVYKFTETVAYYERKDIDELNEILAKLRHYKLEMKKNKTDFDYSRNF